MKKKKYFISLTVQTDNLTLALDPRYKNKFWKKDKWREELIEFGMNAMKEEFLNFIFIFLFEYNNHLLMWWKEYNNRFLVFPSVYYYDFYYFRFIYSKVIKRKEKYSENIELF